MSTRPLSPSYVKYTIKFESVLKEFLPDGVQKWRLFLPEYALLFPDRIIIQASGRRAGCVRVCKPNGPHFRIFSETRLCEIKERAKVVWRKRREEAYATAKAASIAWIAELAEANRRKWADYREVKYGAKRREMMARKLEREERRKKGLDMFHANMTLSRKRKDARRIKAAFLADWGKRYGFLFHRVPKAVQKRSAMIRKERIRAKKDKNVAKIIRMITSKPCRCYWCGTDLPNGGEVDHVVPLVAGGEHGNGNLVPSCLPCNRKKQGMPPNDPKFSRIGHPELLLISA